MPSHSGPSTTILHRAGADAHGPLTTPIYETSTYVFESADAVRAYQEGRVPGYLYSRYENPTVVERREDSRRARGCRDRAAALVGDGRDDHCADDADAGRRRSAVQRGDLRRHAASAPGRAGALRRSGAVPVAGGADAVRSPGSPIARRVLWFESPINPTLRCVDIRAVAAACRACGVTSVIDNTFASPINQQPLALGVDLVMHSATKYLERPQRCDRGRHRRAGSARRTASPGRGACSERFSIPLPAYALGRGLKTLPVRVARQNASALAIAEFLARDARVSAVLYPGLPSHPDHAIAREQMQRIRRDGHLRLGGSYERAARAFDRLEVVRRAASLGGVESICSHAGAHVAVRPQRRPAARRGHHAGDDSPVGGTRGRRRSDRGPGSGAGLAGRRTVVHAGPSCTPDLKVRPTEKALDGRAGLQPRRRRAEDYRCTTAGFFSMPLVSCRN